MTEDTTDEFAIFRRNLKIARFLKQMTAEELSVAAKLNIRNKKRIADIEGDRGRPTLEEVIAICRCLEQTIDNMLNKKASITITWE